MHRALSFSVLLVSLSTSAAPASAQRALQFRVNATPGEAWNAGVHEAAVAVKPNASLSFAWVARSNLISASACPNLLVNCDLDDVAPDVGSSQSDPQAVVFARDLSATGKPRETVDTGIDPVLACISNRRVPSIAAKRTPDALRGIVSMWDFEWNPLVPPCNGFCGDPCAIRLVATNDTRWPSEGPPLVAGPHPGRCTTYSPSVAASETSVLESWVDVSTLCTELWARRDPGVTQLVRGHVYHHAVGTPCAGAGLAERYVVLWNEFDGVPNTISVRLRRIDGDRLGAIVDVGFTDRPAAVSVFDDGSFAVFFFDTSNALDPRGRVALYGPEEPPVRIGGLIDITTTIPFEGPRANDRNLTVTVRGPSVSTAGARVLSAWERHDELFPGQPDVAYRLLDAPRRYLGREHAFATDIGRPKFLGESGQHTVVFRRDGTAAGVWVGHEDPRPLPDRNVYCTLRMPEF